MCKKYLYRAIFFVCNFFSFAYISGLIVGSNTAVARQATAIFPASGTDNEMRGFYAFEGGVILETGLTTCTFNALFPVQEDINLGWGTLFLAEDLTLGNSSRLDVPGRIRGNNYSIIFSETNSDREVPHVSNSFTFNALTAVTLTSSVNSVDWSYTGAYAAGVINTYASGGTGVFAYSFNGSALTANGTAVSLTTASQNEVRWHPSTNYFATIATRPATQNTLFIYRISGTSIALTSSRDVGGNGYTCAWHSSGNYLLTGSDRASAQVERYGYTSGTGVLSSGPQQALNIGSTVYAIAVAPGGNYVAFGTGASTILIYSFNGTSLSASAVASITAGAQVNTLDWSPTGTYIIAGFNASTDTVRMYSFISATNTLSEVTAARIGESTPVTDVNWNKNGQFLTYCTKAGASSEYTTYYFEQATGFLMPVNYNYSTIAVNAIRWSKDGNYVLRGTAAASSNMIPATVTPSTAALVFDGVTVQLNAHTTVSSKWKFRGACTVDGNDKKLIIAPGASIEISDNSQVNFQHVVLTNVGTSNIRSLTNNAQIRFEDSVIALARDFTLTQAGLYFVGDVLVTGTSTFVYQSPSSSTIASGATLYLDNGVTFSYSPSISNKNLLVMTDVSSGLYLNGATLVSTLTGLRLSTGTLFIDNNVTFSSQARNSGEACEISSGLNIQALAGAVLDIFGIVKYV